MCISYMSRHFKLSQRSQRRHRYGGVGKEQGKQIVESAAKNRSDDVAAVLKSSGEEFGRFAHHSMPHTFRHTFATWMLDSEADIGESR